MGKVSIKDLKVPRSNPGYCFEADSMEKGIKRKREKRENREGKAEKINHTGSTFGTELEFIETVMSVYGNLSGLCS